MGSLLNHCPLYIYVAGAFVEVFWKLICIHLGHCNSSYGNYYAALSMFRKINPSWYKISFSLFLSSSFFGGVSKSMFL